MEDFSAFFSQIDDAVEEYENGTITIQMTSSFRSADRHADYPLHPLALCRRPEGRARAAQAISQHRQLDR
jgi:hypothetical protein